MNENQRKCRKCLNKANKDEIIKTRDGYYCEVCHKKNESYINKALGIIAGFFIIALIIMLVWKYYEIKTEEKNHD